jgi:hypothetical protein
MVPAALDEAIPLQRDEVVVDRARRGQADRVSDLADRRGIPAVLHRLRDTVEDPLPSLVVVSGHMPSALAALCVRYRSLPEHLF